MPKPVIDESKCTGCFTCVSICPMEIYIKDEAKKKSFVNPKKESECLGCKACEVQCPSEAIKVKD